MEERVSTVWAEKFIKENLDLTVKVKSCRNSGNVIVIGLENSETKREVMSNKNKLKGKRFSLNTALLDIKEKYRRKLING